jgi:hypothetical protein
MKSDLPPPTGNWTTLILLWKAARVRAAGRQKRQGELMKRKTGSSSDTLGGLAMVFVVVVMGFVHGSLGWMLTGALKTSQIENLENEGRLVLVSWQYQEAERLEKLRSRIEEARMSKDAMSPEKESHLSFDKSVYADKLDAFGRDVSREKRRDRGEALERHKKLIINHFKKHGLAGFQNEKDIGSNQFSAPASIPVTYWPFVGFMLLWWLVMIVFQGEGLELDIQRRRHPMWEWLLSHPVRPLAAFAESLRHGRWIRGRAVDRSALRRRGFVFEQGAGDRRTAAALRAQSRGRARAHVLGGLRGDDAAAFHAECPESEGVARVHTG